MSGTPENPLALLVQDLRYIQSANQVLAECLSRICDEPEADKERQNERLWGVAFLMDLVSEYVEAARVRLRNEITAR
jgi:hypothetical protein